MENTQNTNEVVVDAEATEVAVKEKKTIGQRIDGLIDKVKANKKKIAIGAGIAAGAAVAIGAAAIASRHSDDNDDNETYDPEPIDTTYTDLDSYSDDYSTPVEDADTTPVEDVES